MLTDKGIAETKKLVEHSNANIYRKIKRLSATECKKLENAADQLPICFRRIWRIDHANHRIRF